MIIVKEDMENDAVQCPICSKNFVQGLIEAHASKCLFLNETTTETQRFLKRPTSTSPGVVKKARSKVIKSENVIRSSLSTTKKGLDKEEQVSAEKNVRKLCNV